MVIAKSQEYKVEIYGSANLKNWSFHSNFSSGLYGFQYEFPALIEIPIENSTDSKWVMIVAINPGSPLGGSSNQYFVGEFDGFTFTLDDTQTRFMDVGMDFYAFQTFSDVNDGVVGLAWAYNWQYANFVPTENWRNSMSLARNYTLRKVYTNPETSILSLIQRPIIPDSVTTVNSIKKNSFQPTANNTVYLSSKNSTGVFDFKLRFTVTDTNITYYQKVKFDVLIQSQREGLDVETVTVGFDAGAPSFYLNRAIDNKEFKDDLFTNNFAAYSDPLTYDSKELPIYELYGIVDRNIVELYFNDGALEMTNTFFMSEGKYPHLLKLVANNEDPKFIFEEILFRQLKIT